MIEKSLIHRFPSLSEIYQSDADSRDRGSKNGGVGGGEGFDEVTESENTPISSSFLPLFRSFSESSYSLSKKYSRSSLAGNTEFDTLSYPKTPPPSPTRASRLLSMSVSSPTRVFEIETSRTQGDPEANFSARCVVRFILIGLTTFLSIAIPCFALVRM